MAEPHGPNTRSSQWVAVALGVALVLGLASTATGNPIPPPGETYTRGIPLQALLAIEAAIVCIALLRHGFLPLPFLVSMIVVNLATWNCLSLMMRWVRSHDYPSVPWIIGLEIAVVVLEAAAIMAFARIGVLRNQDRKPPGWKLAFAISLTANLLSLGLGALFPYYYASSYPVRPGGVPGPS